MRYSAARRALVMLAAAAATLAGTAAVAAANDPLPDGTSLASFANASVPQWNFARTLNRDTCWPQAALTAGGGQASPAQRRSYPTAGQGGCVPAGTAFPTYTTVRQCTTSEIRVSYTLYFPKDGFAGSLLGLPLGHAHDFEQVVVVWTRSGGTWLRDRLLMSRHGEFVPAAWSQVLSWNAARTVTGVGLEHPRVFVGWAKHAMFNNAGGGSDLLSQYTDNEFRSATYTAWPGPIGSASQLEVPEGGSLSQQFDKHDWGSATSTPAVLARQLCEV
jgi:Necrosis inducing protein (NPP1)